MKDNVTRRTPRWVRVVLVLSLAGNLAVAAMMAGAWMGHDPGPHGPRIFGPTGVGFYARALTADQRHALAEDLRAQRGALLQGRRDLHRHVRDLLAVLREEALDPAALHDVMEAQVDRARGQIGLGANAMSRLIEGMSPDERAAFADRLEEALNRKRPRR